MKGESWKTTNFEKPVKGTHLANHEKDAQTGNCLKPITKTSADSFLLRKP